MYVSVKGRINCEVIISTLFCRPHAKKKNTYIKFKCVYTYTVTLCGTCTSTVKNNIIVALAISSRLAMLRRPIMIAIQYSMLD